jgi:hypothetical protein
MQIWTREKNGGANKKVLAEDGMGGEGDMEVRVVG